MILIGEIQKINQATGTYQVRVPVLEPPGNFKNSFNFKMILTANAAILPGVYNGYKEKDAVYVDFLEGDVDDAVIIGKVYQGTSKENSYRGVIKCESLEAEKLNVGSASLGGMEATQLQALSTVATQLVDLAATPPQLINYTPESQPAQEREIANFEHAIYTTPQPVKLLENIPQPIGIFAGNYIYRKIITPSPATTLDNQRVIPDFKINEWVTLCDDIRINGPIKNLGIIRSILSITSTFQINTYPENNGTPIFDNGYESYSATEFTAPWIPSVGADPIDVTYKLDCKIIQSEYNSSKEVIEQKGAVQIKITPINPPENFAPYNIDIPIFTIVIDYILDTGSKIGSSEESSEEP